MNIFGSKQTDIRLLGLQADSIQGQDVVGNVFIFVIIQNQGAALGGNIKQDKGHYKG